MLVLNKLFMLTVPLKNPLANRVGGIFKQDFAKKFKSKNAKLDANKMLENMYDILLYSTFCTRSFAFNK